MHVGDNGGSKLVTAQSARCRDDLKGLPAAYATWRESELGRITDTLEQDLILRRVGPPTGLRILDAGCGDGILAVELAARGAQATGIDTSPGMIAAARQRARGRGVSVDFEQAAVEALPFAAGSFDVVIAITVLCFIGDAAGALGEMARVLKPGGRLIIGELGRYSSWALVRRIKGWLGSPVWGNTHFRTRSEFTRLAIAAGLSDVSVSGAIFYPPIGIAARLLGPIDRKMGACTSLGAAFLMLNAAKSKSAETDTELLRVLAARLS